jgi:hypothetical protein
VGVPEDLVHGKQDVAVCYRAYGGSEEDVVGYQNVAVRIRIRRWPQVCHP